MRNTAAGIQFEIAKGVFRPHTALTNMALAYYQNAANYFAKALFPTCPVMPAWEKMKTSDEWQNADMFGKMDIAWDTLGIKLTTEEQEDYTSNIETFVKSKIEELESRTFAAHIHVQTYLGGTEEGQTLAQNIEKWATADYVELDGLSSQLSQKESCRE